MGFLERDEYKQIYQAVKEHQDEFTVISEEGPLNIDDYDEIDEETVDKLKEGLAIHRRSVPYYNRRVKAGFLGEVALEFLEEGKEVDDFIEEMEDGEVKNAEYYNSNK